MCLSKSCLLSLRDYYMITSCSSSEHQSPPCAFFVSALKQHIGNLNPWKHPWKFLLALGSLSKPQGSSSPLLRLQWYDTMSKLQGFWDWTQLLMLGKASNGCTEPSPQTLIPWIPDFLFPLYYYHIDFILNIPKECSKIPKGLEKHSLCSWNMRC